MIDRTELWIVIICLGIGSFALRFAFTGLVGDRKLPDWLMRHLRYTAVGILARHHRAPLCFGLRQRVATTIFHAYARPLSHSHLVSFGKTSSVRSWVASPRSTHCNTYCLNPLLWSPNTSGVWGLAPMS